MNRYITSEDGIVVETPLDKLPNNVHVVHLLGQFLTQRLNKSDKEYQGKPLEYTGPADADVGRPYFYYKIKKQGRLPFCFRKTIVNVDNNVIEVRDASLNSKIEEIAKEASKRFGEITLVFK